MQVAGEYVALFAWSFLAATLLPVGSELPFAVLVRREGQILLPILVATSGNSLGAFTTYWLGRRAVAFAEGRHAMTPRAQRAAELVRRHGQPVVAFSWVPLLGDALVAAAGAARMPVAQFGAWMVLGKLARYGVVAWTVLRFE